MESKLDYISIEDVERASLGVLQIAQRLIEKELIIRKDLIV